MNNLHLRTRVVDGRIRVYWKTGQQTQGCFQVEMPPMPDANIAAELAVARLLLEDRNACGYDKTGAGLCLEVTHGAIRKLLRNASYKEHLAAYALFLRTRFAGASVTVVKRADDWVAQTPQEVELLTVTGPAPTMIEVGGYGPVELTGHAFDQYVARFEKDPGSKKIWRNLRTIARVASPVRLTNRSALHDIKHRREGAFVWNRAEDIMMVVVLPANAGVPRLVTIYKPSEGAKRGAAALA